MRYRILGMLWIWTSVRLYEMGSEGVFGSWGRGEGTTESRIKVTCGLVVRTRIQLVRDGMTVWTVEREKEGFGSFGSGSRSWT